MFRRSFRRSFERAIARLAIDIRPEGNERPQRIPGGYDLAAGSCPLVQVIPTPSLQLVVTRRIAWTGNRICACSAHVRAPVVRDHVSYTIFEGTSGIQRLVVARSVSLACAFRSSETVRMLPAIDDSSLLHPRRTLPLREPAPPVRPARRHGRRRVGCRMPRHSGPLPGHARGDYAPMGVRRGVLRRSCSKNGSSRRRCSPGRAVRIRDYGLFTDTMHWPCS